MGKVGGVGFWAHRAGVIGGNGIGPTALLGVVHGIFRGVKKQGDLAPFLEALPVSNWIPFHVDVSKPDPALVKSTLDAHFKNVFPIIYKIN